MAYEMKDNTGSLFKNDRRESDNHPNLRGQVMVNGEEYWVSAWTKVKGDGEKWLSLAFTPKEIVAKPAQGGGTLLDDSVPFAPW